MNYVLLLGAGFSRNWGGWLANEAFEFLLGVPEIAGNAAYRQLLWRCHGSGGFEAALGEVQAAFRRDRNTNQKALADFQSAIAQMFDAMNDRFRRLSDDKSPNIPLLWRFLNRFDAIFTLNQDSLMECSYLCSAAKPGIRQWKGSQLPGVEQYERGDTGMEPWATGVWGPRADGVVHVDPDFQPYFKLHGSANWRIRGEPLMVMGTGKARAIHLHPLLSEYANLFENYLFRPMTRLAVIGYSFGDEHINEVITRASESHGLKIFVFDPHGADLAKVNNQTRARGAVASPSAVEQLFEQSLIGASRRPLLQTFGDDRIELDKVERHFWAV